MGVGSKTTTHNPCCLRVSKMERNQNGYKTPTVLGPKPGKRWSEGLGQMALSWAHRALGGGGGVLLS